MQVRTGQRKRQTSSIPGGIITAEAARGVCPKDLVTVAYNIPHMASLKAMTSSRHSLRIDPIRAFDERILLRARDSRPSAKNWTARRGSLSQRILTCGVPVISSTFGQAAKNFRPPAPRASASLLRQVLG